MAESVGAIGLDLVLNQNQFKSQMKGITSLAKKAGATLAGAFAVKKIVDFGEQCIELGSDLAEVQNVVDVAFPKMNETINNFAKNAATQFGLSETMAKRYTGTFGAMSQAFGFTEKEAATMSTTLTGLSGDVASFYNISQDEAYTKLKSVFTGETESLKDLGVVMTQTALDQYALANGFGKTTAKMSEQEKVALRYQFVQAQLSKASGDFARTSDSWANQTRILSLQLEGLKATLGQGFINLFSPILKAVNTLLGKLGTLANAFKSFTELITGKKSENSSIGAMADDTALVSDNASNAADNVSSIGDAAKKAKKKLGSLASWDELNVRTDDSDSDSSSSKSGGGSISGTSVDYGKAADLGDTAFNKLGKTMDAIKNKFLKMGKLFAQGFSIGFQSKGLDKIKNYLSEIEKNVKDIFLSPEVLSAASKWADNVALNLGKVVGSVSSIGVSIATMLIGGVSKFLDQNKNFIKKKIVEIFDISSQINTIVGNFSVALADIFTVFEGDDAQQIVADILAIFTTVQLELQVLCLKIGRDIIDTITAPIIENKDKIKTALENTIRPISEIIGSIKGLVSDAFSSVQNSYDEYIHPALKKISDGFSKIFSKVLDAYNEYIAPVLSFIADGLKKVFKQYLSPLINSATKLIGNIVDAIADLFNFLSPWIGWLISNVYANIAPAIKAIWTVVQAVFSQICNIVKTLIDVIGGIIDFITGIFTGNWKKAWGGVKDIFSAVVEFFKNSFKIASEFLSNIVKTISDSIKNRIKSTADGVKTVLSSTWEGIKNVFSGVVGFYKKIFGDAWNAIKAIFSNPGKFFSGVWSGIKSAFSCVTDWFKDTFSNAWQAVKNVFSTGGKVFDGIKKGIAGVFKTVVNGLISGINVIISKPFQAINGMLNKIRNVGVAGVEPFKGLWEENPLPIPQIPKLAKGAVIKPSAPFLAMLGDQKHGTNVEAPLDTIKQALREVQNEGGDGSGSANIEVKVYVQQNNKGVFEVVRTEATKFKNRTGKPAFI